VNMPSKYLVGAAIKPLRNWVTHISDQRAIYRSISRVVFFWREGVLVGAGIWEKGTRPTPGHNIPGKSNVLGDDPEGGGHPSESGMGAKCCPARRYPIVDCFDGC